MKKLIKKFKTASPAARASIALLLANLILKGLSLISGPLFTRLMSTEQYGLVSTFQSWQSLLAVLITLNLHQGVFNNGMLEYKENRDKFQYSLLIISTAISVTAILAFSFFSKPFLDLFELPSILVYVMLIYFLFIPAYQFWVGRQRYEYCYKALSAITIGIAVTSLIFGALAVIIAPEDQAAIARVCVMEGVNIAVGLFFFIYIAIKAKFKFSFHYIKYALRFNVPLIPHYLSMYILSSSDRIMITKMVSASATAIYSVAYTVASVINIVWQAIESSLSPWIYEKLSIGDKMSVKDLTIKIMLLFAVMCTGCTLFSPEIMAVLAPDSYSEGVYAIPSISVGVFFTAMYSLYMRIELFYKQTGFATIASFLAALSNIILNYIFISWFGFIAAGYTTMVCYALLALLHYFNVKWKGYSDILDNKKFFAISVITIILSFAVMILYSYNILRYLFIGCIVIALFIKRKKIIEILAQK